MSRLAGHVYVALGKIETRDKVMHILWNCQSIWHKTVVFGGCFIYDFEKEEFYTQFVSIKNK